MDGWLTLLPVGEYIYARGQRKPSRTTGYGSPEPSTSTLSKLIEGGTAFRGSHDLIWRPCWRGRAGQEFLVRAEAVSGLSHGDFITADRYSVLEGLSERENTPKRHTYSQDN